MPTLNVEGVILRTSKKENGDVSRTFIPVGVKVNNYGDIDNGCDIALEKIRQYAEDRPDYNEDDDFQFAIVNTKESHEVQVRLF